VRLPDVTQIKAFQKRILRFYGAHGRDLPWRKSTDPYAITVSEIMLQQTQVERVADKYQAWLKQWPNWQKLAKATDRELLAAWSGLGYNRRALNLGKLAREVVTQFDGELPRDPEQLLTLPGIGPYTAHAILIFAFNRPLVTIDTNIRKVLLHELGYPASISKENLEALALAVLPRRRSRDWHNALMDFSRLVLPKQIKSIPPISKQSRFQGSLRQIRGEIVRQLITRNKVTISVIAKALKRTEEDVIKAAQGLEKDGMVLFTGKTIRLK
jgi:A/G-specific adenine glycosylase